MPYSILMQTWIRLRGASGSNVVQDEADWIDLTAFQGVSPYVSVAAAAGSPVISLETSPTRDENLFALLQNTRTSSSYSIVGAGVQPVTSFSFENTVAGSAPPGRWLRWKVTGGTNWRIVFRIWLNVLQGRGGAFKDARAPLPPEGHRHPEDHAHLAQPRLEARARERSAVRANRFAPSRRKGDSDNLYGGEDDDRLVAPVGSTIHHALTYSDALLRLATRLGGSGLTAAARAELEHWKGAYRCLPEEGE